MNPIYLNMAASIVTGIALGVVRPLRKNPLRWLTTSATFATLVLLLTYLDLRHGIDSMLASELALIFFGNLCGPAIFLGLGAPLPRTFYRVILAMVTGSICLMAAATISRYAASSEDGHPLPAAMRNVVEERAEQLITKNLSAMVENTTGQKRVIATGDFKDPQAGNPGTYIAQNYGESLVRNKQIGPLYRVDVAGTPTITTLRTADRIYQKKPTEVILADGDVKLSIRVSPFYLKDGKPMWDQTKIITQTLRFQAAFTLENDLKLLHFEFQK